MFGTLTVCDSVTKTPQISPFVVTQKFTYVGRDKDCDIRFENPKCDRKQFLLTSCANGVVKIQNLSKKHDTLVNGKSIGFQVDRDLNEQDSIQAAGKTMMWSYKTSATVSLPPSNSLKRTRQSEPVRKVAVVNPNRRELIVNEESLQPAKRRKTVYGLAAGGTSHSSLHSPLHHHESSYSRRMSYDAMLRMGTKSSTKSRFSSGATPGRLSGRLRTPTSARKNRNTSFANTSQSQSMYFPTIQEGRIMEPSERLSSQQREQFHFENSKSFLDHDYGLDSTPASYFSATSSGTPPRMMRADSPNIQLGGSNGRPSSSFQGSHSLMSNRSATLQNAYQQDEMSDSLFVNTSRSPQIRLRQSQRSFHSNKDHYSPHDSVLQSPQSVAFDGTPSHLDTPRRNSVALSTPGSSSFSPVSYYDTDYVLLSPRGKTILNKNYGRNGHSISMISQSPYSPSQKTLDFSALSQQSPKLLRTPKRSSLSVQVLTKSLKKKLDRGALLNKSSSNSARKSLVKSRTDELRARSAVIPVPKSQSRKFSQKMRKGRSTFGSQSTSSEQVQAEDHSHSVAIQSPIAESFSSHANTSRKSRNSGNKVHDEISTPTNASSNVVSSTADLQPKSSGKKSSRFSRGEEKTKRASQGNSKATPPLSNSARKSRQSVNVNPQESSATSVLVTPKRSGTFDSDSTVPGKARPSVGRESTSNRSLRRSKSNPPCSPAQSNTKLNKIGNVSLEQIGGDIEASDPDIHSKSSRRKSSRSTGEELSNIASRRSLSAPSTTPTQSTSSRKSRSNDIDDSLEQVATRTPKSLRSSQANVESPSGTQPQPSTSRKSRKSENVASPKFAPADVHESPKQPITSDELITTRNSLRHSLTVEGKTTRSSRSSQNVSISSPRSKSIRLSKNIDDSLEHVAARTPKSSRSSQANVESPSRTQPQPSTSRRSRKSENVASPKLAPADVHESPKQPITSDELITTRNSLRHSLTVEGKTTRSSRTSQNVSTSSLRSKSIRLSKNIDVAHTEEISEPTGLPASPRSPRKSKRSVDGNSESIPVPTKLVNSEPEISRHEEISSRASRSSLSKLTLPTSEDTKPHRVSIRRSNKSLESSTARNSRGSSLLDDSSSFVANISSIPKPSKVMFSTPSPSKKQSVKITSTPFPRGLSHVRSVTSESTLPIEIDTENIQGSYISSDSPDYDKITDEDTFGVTDATGLQGSSARTWPVKATRKSKGSVSFVVKSSVKRRIPKMRSCSKVATKRGEVTPPNTSLEVNLRSSRKSGTIIEKPSHVRSTGGKKGKPARRLNDSLLLTVSEGSSVRMTTPERSEAADVSSLASPLNTSTPTRLRRSQSNVEDLVETHSSNANLITPVKVGNSPTKSQVRSGSPRTSRKSESPEKRTPPKSVSPKVVLRSSKKSASKSKQAELGTPTSAFKTNPRRSVMKSSRKSNSLTVNPAVKKLKLDPDKPDKNKMAALWVCHKKKSPVKTIPEGSSRRSFDRSPSSPVKVNKTLPRDFKFQSSSSVSSTQENSLTDISQHEPTPLKDGDSQPRQLSPEDDLLNALDLSRKSSIVAKPQKPLRRLRSSAQRYTPAGSRVSTQEENVITKSSKKLLFRSPLVDYEGSTRRGESHVNSSNIKSILVPSPTTSSNEPMSRVLTTSPVVDYTDSSGKKKKFLASPTSKSGGIRELIPSDEIDLSGVRDLFEQSSLVLNAAPNTPPKPKRGRKRSIAEVDSSPKMADVSPPAKRSLRRKKGESNQPLSSGSRTTESPAGSSLGQQRLRSKKPVKAEVSTSKTSKAKASPVKGVSPKKQTPVKSASKSKKTVKQSNASPVVSPKKETPVKSASKSKKNVKQSKASPVSPKKQIPVKSASKSKKNVKQSKASPVSPKKQTPVKSASKSKKNVKQSKASPVSPKKQTPVKSVSKSKKNVKQSKASPVSPKKQTPVKSASKSKKNAKTEKLSPKKVEKSSAKRAKTPSPIEVQSDTKPKKQEKGKKTDTKKNKNSSLKIDTPVVSPRKMRSVAKPEKTSLKQVVSKKDTKTEKAKLSRKATPVVSPRKVRSVAKPKKTSLKQVVSKKDTKTEKAKLSIKATPVVSPRKIRSVAKPKKTSLKQVVSKKDTKTEKAKLSRKKTGKSSSNAAKTPSKVQNDDKPKKGRSKVKTLQISPPKKQGKVKKADTKKNENSSSSKVATPKVSPRKMRNAAKPKKPSPKQVVSRRKR